MSNYVVDYALLPNDVSEKELTSGRTRKLRNADAVWCVWK